MQRNHNHSSEEESQELLFVHPWTNFTDGLWLFQYKWVFYSLLPYLEPGRNSNLGQETKKNRAKGHLKCVPKTIMGPEDCAAPHVSFFWKSVRAQVHLWNIHSLSLSDFSGTEDFCRIGSFVEAFCVQAQSFYHDLFFLCFILIWFTCSRILVSRRNIPMLSWNRIMS